MYCEECGKKINKNSKYCSHCGTPTSKKSLVFILSDILDMEVSSYQTKLKINQVWNLLDECEAKLSYNEDRIENMKNFYHEIPTSFFEWIQDESTPISFFLICGFCIGAIILLIIETIPNFSWDFFYLFTFVFTILVDSIVLMIVFFIGFFLLKFLLFILSYLLEFIYWGSLKLVFFIDKFLFHHLKFYQNLRRKTRDKKIKQLENIENELKRKLRDLVNEENSLKKTLKEQNMALKKSYEYIHLSAKYQNLECIQLFLEYLENHNCDTLKECLNKYDYELQNHMIKNEVLEAQRKINETNENTLRAIEEVQYAGEMARKAYGEAKGARKTANRIENHMN